MEVIEKYLQILLPLFIISQNFQSKESSICTVIPSLLMTIHATLMRMILHDDEQNTFRLALVKYMHVKFKHELNSDTYHAAAILHVSDINLWRLRSFGRRPYSNAHTALVRVLEAHYQREIRTNGMANAVATSRPSNNFIQTNVRADPALTLLSRMSRMSVADEDDVENDQRFVRMRLAQIVFPRFQLYSVYKTNI
jgi:hypothetical protein